MSKLPKPTIYITKEAWDKLWWYTHAVKTEISGFGRAYRKCERDIESASRDVIIEDIFILEQTCSAAGSTLKEEVIHKQLSEECKNALKAEEEDRAAPLPLNMWWHSHASMGVFWSGTDDATGRQFMNSDWMVHIVVNRKDQYKCRLVVYNPVMIDMDDLDLEVIDEAPFEIPEEIKQEVEEKVTEREYFSQNWQRSQSYPYSANNPYPYSHQVSPGTAQQGEFFDKNEEEEHQLGDKVWVRDRDSWNTWYHGIITKIASVDEGDTYNVYIGSQEKTYTGLLPILLQSMDSVKGKQLTNLSKETDKPDGKTEEIPDSSLYEMSDELDVFIEAGKFKEAYKMATKIMESDPALGKILGIPITLITIKKHLQGTEEEVEEDNMIDNITNKDGKEKKEQKVLPVSTKKDQEKKDKEK